MRALFVASEVDGFVKTGGLADVARALPAALHKQGHEVRIIMPCYRKLLQKAYPMAFGSVHVRLSTWDERWCALRKAEIDGVEVYLLEHDLLYDRAGIYDENGEAYRDNCLRYALLCQAAFTLCEALNWFPDVLHCNDWQTALVPYYLKVHRRGDPRFTHTRSLLTIHNGAYQGWSSMGDLEQVGVNPTHFGAFEHGGVANLLKAGLLFADSINAVSPGYRQELMHEPEAGGLSTIYQHRHQSFSGILNGCDYGQWDPETDPVLAANYSADDLSGKADCKRWLQEEYHLETSADIPLFGSVSRLTDQKGFTILIPALWQLLSEHNVQVVLLGSGDRELAAQLHHLQHYYPHNVRFIEGYDVDLSHRIEAGVDFFMMPSLFEPCGLNQIYSLKYGTPPIVRATGGLRDTVVPLNSNQTNGDQATGFMFEHADMFQCLDALRYAAWVYEERQDLYQWMQRNGMAADFSWDEPVQRYLQLYGEGSVGE